MALIVQKYGGTSVGSTDRIRNVAKRIARYHREGHQLVVVVSAMSGETNRLLALAKELASDPNPRELDVVAATGEQVTIGHQHDRARAVAEEHAGTAVGPIEDARIDLGADHDCVARHA